MMEGHRSPLFLAVALIAILAELAWRLRYGRGYDGRAAMTTLGLVAGDIVAAGLNAAMLGGLFGALWAAVPHRFPATAWTSWALGFFAVEIAYYAFHRASHKIRWMWATHSVHHSAEELTFLASMRLGWTNLLSLGWLAYAPLVIAGFDPRIIFVLLAINLNYQFFLHSEAIPRLGPLEWIFNTPHHHRAHHALNREMLDRNYGGMLIVWDRVFGTIAPEPTAPLRYGVLGQERTNNPIVIVLREWRAMLRAFSTTAGWRGKIRALIAMPSPATPD